MTCILGIDPGTACGWAVRHADGRWDSGVWDLSTKRHEGGGMRFLRLRTNLRAALALSGAEVIAYEEVRRHRGVSAAHIYGGIVALIQEECESRHVAYVGIPVGTVKKHATGKGNAPKALVTAAAEDRWRRSFTHDEADARWIAEVAASQIALA